VTNSAESWLVDSGASKHMTGNTETLANFKNVKFSSQFELGDDMSYAIKGTGSTSFQLKSGFILHIEDILYVPGLTKNLISIGILEDKVHREIFLEKKALLWPKDTEFSLAIVIGIKGGRLHKVLGHIQALVCNISSSCELWHRRFGHLHFKVLPGPQKMVSGMPTFQFNHNTIWKGCMLGKNIKKSFLVSNKREKVIFRIDSFRGMWAYVHTFIKWACVLCDFYR
jgi:hypothetical protein